MQYTSGPYSTASLPDIIAHQGVGRGHARRDGQRQLHTSPRFQVRLIAA